MIFSPHRTDTIVDNIQFEWRPRDFPAFIEEFKILLSKINEQCLFRGHRKNEWMIDSTFARSLKVEQELLLTDMYSDKQINNVIHQHTLAKHWIKKVKKIVVSPDLLKYVPQGIEPLFEYHRHLQQNQKDSRLNDVKPYGSNLIDFTEDWKVGLFFANLKRDKDDEGALFLVRQTTLGPVLYRGNTPFYDTFRYLKKHLKNSPDRLYGILPLWIEPNVQLNNLQDQKPKRQRAVYLAQMDFRVNLELAWKLRQVETREQIFIKLVLPKGTYSETEEFLTKYGIDYEYLFPKTIFD